MSEYMKLTELGQVYGVDAATVGRWLKGLLLRHPDGKPTQQAIQDGFVKERLTEFGSSWLWSREKTCDILDGMGYPRGGMLSVVEEHGDFVIIRAR